MQTERESLTHRYGQIITALIRAVGKHNRVLPLWLFPVFDKLIKTTHMRAIVLLSYIASGLLAGIAGILVAQIGGTVDPAFGFDLMIFGFVAAVLGGIGSSVGALTGGVLVGLIEKLVGGYISTSAGHGIVFCLLILMLVARPQGLFGERDIVKV